ncbi:MULTISPECIES: hypothetical protein [Deefgea]|uniref:Thioredoxin-like fold domain-containing protein n=1 Tax=Deefgea chitinilytica TaxID=570276 RepID=A0ABS2C9C8_9NEIS|nr:MULTISPECIES: hypothetical protein [Deefgea]MBM5570738.1 hypothetical protein [Deefgea chitinilytica]MBM9887967.1 hypothetical protein [Deefgea sp. CFH1-16]
MMAFTATLPSSKRAMTKNATATETLVKGIYAIWTRLDDERDVILVNENATIFSLTLGKDWRYTRTGAPTIENPDELRNALRANIRFDELVAKRIGAGQRKVVYFGAYDCPWCKVFQSQLKNTKGLNTTTYLVPTSLDVMIPNAMSRQIVRSLWCDTRGWSNWDAFMQTRQPSLLQQPSVSCSPLKTAAQAHILMGMTATTFTFPRLVDDTGWAGNLPLKPGPSPADWARVMGSNNKSAVTDTVFTQQVDLSNWGKTPSTSQSGSSTYQIGEGAGQESKADGETLNLGGIKIKLPSIKY